MFGGGGGVIKKSHKLGGNSFKKSIVKRVINISHRAL